MVDYVAEVRQLSRQVSVHMIVIQRINGALDLRASSGVSLADAVVDRPQDRRRLRERFGAVVNRIESEVTFEVGNIEGRIDACIVRLLLKEPRFNLRYGKQNVRRGTLLSACRKEDLA